MKTYAITFSLFLLFVLAHSQEEGDLGAFRQSPEETTPEQEVTEPPQPQPSPSTSPKPSKKPRRSTTTAAPQAEAKTDAPAEPLNEECTQRVDIILPLLSQCTNCTVNADCNRNSVCCPVSIFSFFGNRNPDNKCCVIKKPVKVTTEAP
uniref:WAP domain-containing protein n=1 Tax=Strigamia maritima TaxID=126957 RepID=T1IL88_STRMM